MISDVDGHGFGCRRYSNNLGTGTGLLQHFTGNTNTKGRVQLGPPKPFWQKHWLQLFTSVTPPFWQYMVAALGQLSMDFSVSIRFTIALVELVHHNHIAKGRRGLSHGVLIQRQV